MLVLGLATGCAQPQVPAKASADAAGEVAVPLDSRPGQPSAASPGGQGPVPHGGARPFQGPGSTLEQRAFSEAEEGLARIAAGPAPSDAGAWRSRCERDLVLAEGVVARLDAARNDPSLAVPSLVRTGDALRTTAATLMSPVPPAGADPLVRVLLQQEMEAVALPLATSARAAYELALDPAGQGDPRWQAHARWGLAALDALEAQ